MNIKNFYNLEIWKEAHQLSIDIYKLTTKLPSTEKYGVIDQLRRASVSVSANIAEGFGRYHYKDKTKFYYNARGSCCEVQSFIFLMKDLGYIDLEIAENIIQRYELLIKRVNTMIKSVGLRVPLVAGD